MATILIIEDQAELVKVLRSYLERAGFSVLSSFRGDAGLSIWEYQQPDLVILDLNLPGLDGWDVARAIRRKADTPILMLTARVEEADQIYGLELGADEYVTKPFSPRVVVARVRALLRRAETGSSPGEIIQAADVIIDLNAHRVLRQEQEIDLTPTEFSLLATLAEQPGHAFTRKQLVEACQEQVSDGYERTIDVHIKNLRAKLEPDPKNPRYIETLFGIGYRFKTE
ncbi:MAG: OmpR family two-component response regulator [Chloroflexi bacterium]|nr:OmpR family two-component response regulator [Chloroflexota bacterium]